MASNGVSGSLLPHVVTTNIEHVAVELPLKKLEERGEIGNASDAFFTF